MFDVPGKFYVIHAEQGVRLWEKLLSKQPEVMSLPLEAFSLTVMWVLRVKAE